jgi:hypothetical protein
MNILDWADSLVALVAILAAIVAWVAKIRWATEYKAAKEAQIASLQRQVQILETLSTPRLMDRLKAMNEFHELERLDWQQRNDHLQQRLDETEAKQRANAEEIGKLIEPSASSEREVQIPASVSARVAALKSTYTSKSPKFRQIADLFQERENLARQKELLEEWQDHFTTRGDEPEYSQ